MVPSEGRLILVSTAPTRLGLDLAGRKEQMSNSHHEWSGSMSDCKACNHPLIDHGDFPEDPCDCCSGRIWSKINQKPSDHVLPEPGPKGRRDGRILPKFRQIPDFPDYMINRQGCVKHIATGKYCLFLRLTSSGGAMISLQQNGRARNITIQELLVKTFPARIEKENIE